MNKLELQKLNLLKAKLEYEVEATGEVDPVDFNEYMYYIQKCYKEDRNVVRRIER